MFFYQTPFIPEMLLRADDFGFINRIFRKKPTQLLNKENVTDEDIDVFKYTFSQEGKSLNFLIIISLIFRFK